MDLERATMVREAAKEAASEALHLFSKDTDLKLERAERRILESIGASVDGALQRYIGMTAIEHGIAHSKADDAVGIVNEIRKEVRTWFIRAIMVGALITTGAVYQTNGNNNHNIPYVKPQDEHSDEPLKEFHPE